MTGKLSPHEMLRRLDIIAERRGQARQRRREARTTPPPADNPSLGHRSDQDGATDASERAPG